MPKISNHQKVLQIGRWLKWNRETCHMSREELAVKVHSTYEMIRLYEEGQCVMRVDRLCDLASALGIDCGMWFQIDTQNGA